MLLGAVRMFDVLPGGPHHPRKIEVGQCIGACTLLAFGVVNVL
jgi:hypothetical protein